MNHAAETLGSRLDYEPVSLKFGTSGRRGLVKDLTQLEIYINVLAELEYLQSLSPFAGGISKGDEVYFASNLRPSSTRFDDTAQGRGEMAQAIARAITDTGMKPVYLGHLPTPALASFALDRVRGSIMVTGSHIPFDRNGYKTNTAQGELLKKDEGPIQCKVDQVRARIYDQPYSQSPFNGQGMFKGGHSELPPVISIAEEMFLRRYTDFFHGKGLQGKRYLVYQHSAVGPDLLVELLRRFGAEVIPVGRSETFTPIDTEAIDAEQLGTIELLARAAWVEHGPLDAMVSTDGDSDRPLLLGVEPVVESDSAVPCRVRFFGGDLVGMVVAEYLKADAVAVPISCNDAVDIGPLKDYVEPKTRIGSPYVIAGMQNARNQGRKVVCGWEANGGFLLGLDLKQNGKVLAALPTRDAFLPILAVLLCAQEESVAVSTLFDRLPRRFSRAALLKNFPRATSLSLIEQFSPADAKISKSSFHGNRVVFWRDFEFVNTAGNTLESSFIKIREKLEQFFSPDLGYGSVKLLDYTDGVRIHFANGDVAHVRPSGNADELRIYAVADTQARANAIAQLCVAEPMGIFRQLERITTTRHQSQPSSVNQATNHSTQTTAP